MAKLAAVSLLLTVVDGVEQLEAVQSVLAFLDDDKEKYHYEFPLKEASPPADPEELAQWHADMCRDVTEQEQDPAGVKSYNYDYSEDDWLEEFWEELFEIPQGRGPQERNYYLKPLKENCIFAYFIGG
jgi:hypothetical protein